MVHKSFATPVKLKGEEVCFLDSLLRKRFRAVWEERESKIGRKMGRTKELGGEERKEMLADKPPDFENDQLDLSCVSGCTNILK